MDWEDKVFEEKFGDQIDSIYRSIFENKVLKVKRSIQDQFLADPDIQNLDQLHGIDTIIKFTDSSTLTVQEKILRHSNKKYNSLTLEYENNTEENNDGDWFHLDAQLYLFAYANEEETEIDNYWVLNTVNLKMFLTMVYGFEKLKDKFMRYNNPPAQASFFAIPFEILEEKTSIIMFKK